MLQPRTTPSISDLAERHVEIFVVYQWGMGFVYEEVRGYIPSYVREFYEKMEIISKGLIESKVNGTKIRVDAKKIAKY